MTTLSFLSFFRNSIKGFYCGGVSADGTIAQKNQLVNINKKKLIIFIKKRFLICVKVTTI